MFVNLITLNQIHRHLKIKQSAMETVPYFVPGLWFDPQLRNASAYGCFNPCTFFLRQIESILEASPSDLIEGENGDWTKKAVIYNAYIRLLTAYDHNHNGSLDYPLNSHGFRESGTFLKTIALLPYLKHLGINTLHLLPITSIGCAHKKGSLGSPYATKNLYELDPNLSEPFLDLGAEVEFKALIEAAHHLGIRVVLEFVFRTASRDSDWITQHPDWFYWIKEEEERHYRSPEFSPDLLIKIIEKVQKNDFLNSIPPSLQYQAMFRDPPRRDTVLKRETHWTGTLEDGKQVKVPGAFSDWPPSDLQPPWEDVTYLKMYDHPEFNYIAYNTVRMYDESLAQETHKKKELWETLEQVIPYYQKNFKIDGVMIDMGHALPQELLKKMVSAARTIDPDFAFWEENFHLTPKSKEQGYNAAIGYVWAVEHHPSKLRELFQRFETEKFPVPFFGTSESHNTPRSKTKSGGILFSRFSWALNNFLPVIPFLHQGFELGEEIPVNTGLDFSSEEIKKYCADSLPLFSLSKLDWESKIQFCDFIKKISELRLRYSGLIQSSSPATFKLIHFEEGGLFAFERKNALQRLVILGNMNFDRSSWDKVSFHSGGSELKDIISGRKFYGTNGIFEFSLNPGEILIFDLASS